MGHYGPIGTTTTGGGGSVTYNQFAVTGEWQGPSSYTTGGFVIDLSAALSQLNWLDLAVKTVGANLPPARYEFTMDSPSAGKATIKVVRHQYTRVSSFGSVTGQPSGVTVQGTSGQAASSESTHTHAVDHNHGSYSSATNANNGGGQTLLDALGPNLSAHTHLLDIPNLTVSSGAGTSHNHTDNSLYAHSHGLTQAATALVVSELPNGTNLSGTVWYMAALGVRK